MKDLEKRVLERLEQDKEPRKRRYTFFLDKSVKEAFAVWCKEKGQKESPALEAIIREVIPEKYFR